MVGSVFKKFAIGAAQYVAYNKVVPKVTDKVIEKVSELKANYDSKKEGDPENEVEVDDLTIVDDSPNELEESIKARKVFQAKFKE